MAQLLSTKFCNRRQALDLSSGHSEQNATRSNHGAAVASTGDNGLEAIFIQHVILGGPLDVDNASYFASYLNRITGP